MSTGSLGLSPAIVHTQICPGTVLVKEKLEREGKQLLVGKDMLQMPVGELPILHTMADCCCSC